MVHCVQDTNGGKETDCVNRVVREDEAYHAQYAYLLHHSIDMPQVWSGVKAEKYCLDHPEK